MQLVLHTPLAGAALAASVHGLTDLARPPALLWPYAAATLIPPAWITPAFGAASVVHFGRDVGLGRSCALHALLLLGAWMGWDEAAATALCLYYAFIHVPLHLHKTDVPNRHLFSHAIFLLAVCLQLLPATPVTHLPLPDAAQQLVIGHVLTEEFSGAS